MCIRDRHVAHAALAAGGQHDLLLVAVQVEQDFTGVGVMDDGADGHAQRDVRGGGAVLVRATAVCAVLGAVQARVAEVDQRVDCLLYTSPEDSAPARIAALDAGAHVCVPLQANIPEWDAGLRNLMRWLLYTSRCV